MDLSNEFILFSCTSNANVIVVIVVVFDTSSQIEDDLVKKFQNWQCFIDRSIRQNVLLLL